LCCAAHHDVLELNTTKFGHATYKHELTRFNNRRGCAIWAIELIRREIVRQHPAANVNAVLLDFFLYDLAKEREARGK
jgi:hypothetical protein